MFAIIINVDLNIYDLDAVKFAAYTFTDHGYVKIEKNDDYSAIVKIETDKDAAMIEKKFFNELLHHSLRIKIANQNSKIRERIVLQALVSAGRKNTEISVHKSEKLQSDVSKEISDMALEEEINKLLKEAEEGSYKEDPLNIAVPWEEKNK